MAAAPKKTNVSEDPLRLYQRLLAPYLERSLAYALWLKPKATKRRG